MKRILLAIFILIFSPITNAAEALYKFDPNHTHVLWHASHFDFSEQSGKWPAEGTLMLDEENISHSKVNVTIHMENLSTGLLEFNKHLKGKSFFEVDKYPTATFVSNKVIATGKDTGKVEGILTIRNISKPVTLDVKLNKKGLNPVNDKETIGFTATTTIIRSQFGLKSFLPGVGDKVKLLIQAEAAKESAHAN